MEDALKDLESLFEEALKRSEFDFVLTLINYREMGTRKLTTNLYEWFEAIEFYKTLYSTLTGKEKIRIGLLLYSIFFENSDFYNIIGSLCKLKLGYKGSSYLFWKTKKYERLLGIGEKQDFLLELLDDAGKQNIILFFENNHFSQIRNTFFHSSYSLTDKEYFLHDSEPIQIGIHLESSFEVEEFLFPRIDNIISFFDCFKKLYLDSFNSYKTDKEVIGCFPDPVKVTILGSSDGLKGFVIKNSVQLYGKWFDSGIQYDEKYDMWAGSNIQMYFVHKDTVEINDQLTRYENKSDIVKNNSEFHNLIDKIRERNIPGEIQRATELLVKFGNVRYKKMEDETNQYKKRSYPKIILPYYQKAIDIALPNYDKSELINRVKELES